MARKKKNARNGSPYNPYFGKASDDSHMPEKPFLTWILAIPGLFVGVFVGTGTHEPILGPIFGAIMGIAVGSMLDKWREKRHTAQRDEEEP